MKYNPMIIGEIMRNERKKRHWTQTELIERLNEKGVKVGRNTISEIESSSKNDLSRFSLELLTKLSEIFDCEIGYLLGEYSCPTGRNTDISKETGLSNKAINGIMSIKKESENWQAQAEIMHEDCAYDDMAILNFFLEQSSLFEKILREFQNILNAQYKVPVYFDENKNCFITPSRLFDVLPSEKIVGAEFSEMRCLNLARSVDNPNDYITMSLTDDFFHSVALKTIEETIHTLKKIYEESKGE